ncbi:hypothetical protein [Blastococcus sp. CCUG 61487]|uniref:hypothetical protein n=1 Tax=Blastococcus sp. CCUG 61487 TaxID=1840703 RepID=UPI0010BF827B|nr:hypothetical protein [Blastococcus sp. CCUG 61487]
MEVYQAGTWWSGELLGWRHDASGSCEVWVRVVVGGVEESAWLDLADLRLPERHLGAVPSQDSRDSRVHQELPTSQSVAALRQPAVEDAVATAALPMVRDVAAPAAGESAPTRSGGRRRAPEDTDVHRLGPSAVPVRRGRHRAPADGGRHRAADTGVIQRVEDAASAPVVLRTVPEPGRAARSDARWSAPAPRTARPEEAVGRPDVCGSQAADAEPDLLTRPMRLSDRIPHARRPRLDGSLSSV